MKSLTLQMQSVSEGYLSITLKVSWVTWRLVPRISKGGGKKWEEDRCQFSNTGPPRKVPQSYNNGQLNWEQLSIDSGQKKTPNGKIKNDTESGYPSWPARAPGDINQAQVGSSTSGCTRHGEKYLLYWTRWWYLRLVGGGLGCAHWDLDEVPFGIF